MPEGHVRFARADEREALIELQRRASLMWPEDRAFLLADPGVIDLPADQIAEGHVFVWEAAGAVLGFGVVLPREDCDAELDGLFVEPRAWGRGLGDGSWGERRRWRGRGDAWTKCGFQALGEVATQFSPGVAMVRIV